MWNSCSLQRAIHSEESLCLMQSSGVVILKSLTILNKRPDILILPWAHKLRSYRYVQTHMHEGDLAVHGSRATRSPLRPLFGLESPHHHSSTCSCSVFKTPFWIMAELKLENLSVSWISKCLQIPLFPIKLSRKSTQGTKSQAVNCVT